MLNYLKQVWENKEAIIDGIINLLFSKGKIRVIAEKRRKICGVCPSNSKTGNSPYKLPFNHCKECGCSLLIKPYNMESECPKKFWFSRKL